MKPILVSLRMTSHDIAMNKAKPAKEENSQIKAEKIEEFLPGFSTIDQFTRDMLKTLNFSTKSSNGIPSDRKEDWDYYSTFKGFRRVMKAQGADIKKQMLKLLNYNGIKVPDPGNNVGDMIEMLTETNDQLLERISMNLDEAEGIKKVNLFSMYLRVILCNE